MNVAHREDKAGEDTLSAAPSRAALYTREYEALPELQTYQARDFMHMTLAVLPLVVLPYTLHRKPPGIKTV